MGSPFFDFLFSKWQFSASWILPHDKLNILFLQICTMADQQKASQDNRANQLNPNNAQHQPNKANLDNNANQQNPNNAKSAGHLPQQGGKSK
jgi:hypothetical protein